ncbi:uncharacterized protein BYT42DRAFT_471613, partial [Radiomyces spectabilis]|uniref:uncharacterized protein n=1 Tax=Radiomyces spectabilis TaxID=64574 RepID=UPI002220F89B
TTDENLHHAFAPYGDILSARVECDCTTLHSRGISFVTYRTEETAPAAIESMDEAELDGSHVKV